MNAVSRAAYEATFFLHVLAASWRERPDMIVAVTPALGGAVAAALLSARVGRPLFVLIQDLVAEAAERSGIGGGSRLAALTARLEGMALRPASTVGIVSEGFRAGVEAYGVPPDRVIVVRNWVHIEPSPLTRDEARRQLGWSSEPFVVLHTGNMGFKQDLGNVIQAARHVRDDRIRVVLVGDGSQRAALANQAEGASNVELAPPVSTALYPVLLAAADVLLINERPGIGEMALPSKLTSYLAAGRLVVAAVPPDGPSARELRISGAAVLVLPGEPNQLAAVLDNIAGDPSSLGSMAGAGVKYASEHLTRESSLAAVSASLFGTTTHGSLKRI
jgi:glycosyltransferase involved in cell wall biosynthesis